MGILAGPCIIFVVTGFNLSGVGSILSRSFASGRSVNFEMLIPMTLLMCLGLSGLIYLCVASFFAVPLIIERRIEFWPALEMSQQLARRNLCGILGFQLILVLLALCGELYFGLASLILNPIMTCTTAAAYERIVGLSNLESS
jgi:uncharacterized membrane protein